MDNFNLKFKHLKHMQGDLPSLSISLSTPVYVYAQVKTEKGNTENVKKQTWKEHFKTIQWITVSFKFVKVSYLRSKTSSFLYSEKYRFNLKDLTWNYAHI